MGFFELISSGGITMYVLVSVSILSVAVIIERILYYRGRSRVKRPDFMAGISKELEKGDIDAALGMCKKTDTPFSAVVHSGLNLHGHDEVVISNTMDREITIETVKLERFTSFIGTMGSTAVYIGLFGTVLGIIRAFHDISASVTPASGAGIGVVITGISEALVCTAAGLCVAIPAVIAYNYFVKRIDGFVTDMELSASETLDMLNIAKQK